MAKVKICGLTNFEDARVAVEAGASYLGFILYPPSPRAISVAQTAEIIRRLRSEMDGILNPQSTHRPLFVGVFVNESASTMLEILRACGLDLLQLSGDENPGMVASLSPLGDKVYKAIKPGTVEEAYRLANEYVVMPARDPAPSILVDSHHASLHGGTGVTGDWQTAAALAQKYSGLMLAGGLTAGNVSDAIHKVRPFAVDTASGVEDSPGIKDHAKVREFINNAGEAWGHSENV